MRVTVKLEPDVRAAVDELRRDHGLGVSEALNLLVRRGLARRSRTEPVDEITGFELGLNVDITCTARVLASLDETRW
jgi:hypothetical protein